MIVSNAFMKRSFGKKLIENYLRHRDLTHVIDTSGAYLPGHGTPTTILLARHRQPLSNVVRAVRGTRGETGVPQEPASAPVWREIVDYVDQPGFEGTQISVADAPRSSFSIHPWAIGGGGAAELKEDLDVRGEKLVEYIGAIGFASFPGQEDAFLVPVRTRDTTIKPYVVGDSCREWQCYSSVSILAPYDQSFHLIALDHVHPKRFWPLRTTLQAVTSFGGQTVESLGQPWWGWYRWIPERYKLQFSILFGEIATHNHFVLDRGGKAFNQTAPVIKLPTDATEDQHLELLGLLNSSTACFWLKQICFPKGGDHVGTEGARVTKNQWEERYAFDSTKLKQFPIPEEKPLAITQLIQAEAEARAAVLPEKLCAAGVPTRAQLDAAREQAAGHLARMIALQEELDWQCYRLYGILEDDVTLSADQVPSLQLGERAFEIVLARPGEETIWFERHRSTPITELPSHWPEAYRTLVERRIALIESNRDIALVERPEYKRRWNLPTWDEMERAALKGWLLDRMEANAVWQDHTLVSCAQLRDALARDADWLSLAEVYQGGPIPALDAFVIGLAMPEAVPFLPSLRYTESGLRKREEWEAVWALQRREDAGETVTIPVPPKYVAKDMQKGDYWRLRGGLDVAKERFILYPSLQRDSDGSPVLGWAGWSHLEQAQALALYYQRMRTEEGWDTERLKPILAGLLDLEPWLLQWHNELDPEMGERLGEYFVRYAQTQCQELGFTPQEALAWKPTSPAPRRRKKQLV